MPLKTQPLQRASVRIGPRKAAVARQKAQRADDFVEGPPAKRPSAIAPRRWVEPQIDLATFDYATHVQQVAQGNVSLTSVRERLGAEFGLSATETNTLIEATQKMQDAWGDKAIAEMWTELSLLAYTSKDFFGNFEEISGHPQLGPRRQSTGDSNYILKTDITESAEETLSLSAQEIRAAGLTVADFFVRHAPTNQAEEPRVSPWEKVAIARWLTGPYGRVQTPEQLLSVLSQFKDIAYQERYSEPGYGECATVNPAASSALKEKNLYVVLCGTPNKRSAVGDDHVFLRFFPLNGRPIDIDYSFNQFIDPADSKNLVAGPVAAYHDEVGDLIHKHGGSRNSERFFEGGPKARGCWGMNPAVVRDIATRLGILFSGD